MRLLWDQKPSCFRRVKELSPHSGPSVEQPIQMETEETEANSQESLITSSVRGSVGPSKTETWPAEMGNGPYFCVSPFSFPRKKRNCLPRCPPLMKP